jgi:PPM family protein phosphatase
VTLGKAAALTDSGRKRRLNEDNYVCEPPLFAVADGMGGAQAGEVASGLAAAALRDDDSGPAEGKGEQRVNELIQEANRRVYERQSEDSAVSGMGTTMTVALVDDDRVAMGHVGDSRAYLIRDGSLEQLTEDHSLVAELVRSGKLSPEEADSHPQRSVITRALGTDPEVDVDTFSVETKPGDLFLLCSDGLTSMVDNGTILVEVERNRGDLKAAAKALVRAANRGGGEDNITVIFFEIAGGPESLERTVALPPPEDHADAEDEETLDELDHVPIVETRVVPLGELRGELEAAAGAAVAEAPTDEEEPEPEPESESEPRRHPGRRAVILLVFVFALLASCALIVWGLWRSHFVGAERDGHVAVYQGVPWNIVGNVHLYRPVYVSPLMAAQLSQTERRKLFDHSLDSKASALSAVRRYEQDIRP